MKVESRERKFARLLKKATTTRQAYLLWNWVDRQPEPEPLWQQMEAAMPWAFIS